MIRNRTRAVATAIVASLTLLLGACLLSPGKFAATLDLRKDGRFTYSYTGEIFVLGLTKLADIADSTKAEPKFEPSCYKDEDSTRQRPCTKTEIDEQKATWDQEQQAAKAKHKRDQEMMQAMLGGIDPTSPKAAEELAERLRRQAGWKRVTYKGNGLFEVDFQIAGRIDHDFVFPTIERFPMANTFLTINRRTDGALRIDAPGFAASQQGSGMGGLAGLAMMGAAMGAADKESKDGKEDGDKTLAGLPVLEGTLTLTTDGEILANNTDEGPRADPVGKRLEWKVSPRTSAAPTALVRVGK